MSLFNFRRRKTSAISLKSKGEKQFTVAVTKEKQFSSAWIKGKREQLLIFIHVYYRRTHSFCLETDFSVNYQCALQNAIMFPTVCASPSLSFIFPSHSHSHPFSHTYVCTFIHALYI